MGFRYQVREGESILEIASRNGLLPESLWEAPENSDLRGRRKSFDAVQTGDQVFVPDPRPREESGSTEARHRFRDKRPLGLFLRLEAGDADEHAADDRFVLEATDGSYRAEKTVRDDHSPGDGFLDFHFSGLKRSLSYTLKAIAPDGKEDILFEAVSYPDLAGLSSSADAQPAPEAAWGELPADDEEGIDDVP